MLGRVGCVSPEFIINSDGSWLGVLVCIERMTHRSSTQRATCGNSSLTSMPLSPYFWNLNGEGNVAPVLRSVRRLGEGIDLPTYFCSVGLGSKVSTCDGPPFINRWM